MSINKISSDNEPHPLRDEPLPVRIPSGVSKYPREWCLNDGRPPPTNFIPLIDLCTMESHLEDFVYISQHVLVHIISGLSDSRNIISCNGRAINFKRFFRYAKYGSKRDASLQEDTLGLIKEAVEKHGLTLGEVKALFYVASRPGTPSGPMGTERDEQVFVQRCRKTLNTRYFTGGMEDFDWGGNLSQFKPMLEKALEYFEKVVMADWCELEDE